jgi:hypothetical protein
MAEQDPQPKVDQQQQPDALVNAEEGMCTYPFFIGLLILILSLELLHKLLSKKSTNSL